jgi:hypothetical protein
MSPAEYTGSMEGTAKSPWGIRKYISQVEPPQCDIPFGGGTIKDYGCGACCTANVAMRMGIGIPFAKVVSHYASEGQPLRLFGHTLGVMPWKIRAFFDGTNFRGVRTSASLMWGLRGFYSLLRDRRYVIAALKWKGDGGHYIAVMKNAGGGISVLDPGSRRGDMHMKFKDIGGYLERNGGGFVIGAVGIDAAFAGSAQDR